MSFLDKREPWVNRIIDTEVAQILRGAGVIDPKTKPGSIETVLATRFNPLKSKRGRFMAGVLILALTAATMSLNQPRTDSPSVEPPIRPLVRVAPLTENFSSRLPLISADGTPIPVLLRISPTH